jgi:hypothetical protein
VDSTERFNKVPCLIEPRTSSWGKKIMGQKEKINQKIMGWKKLIIPQ